MLLVFVCSLFLQAAHWLIYTLTEFPAWLLAITPLVLCGIYHVYQVESMENHGSGRLRIFLAGVLSPFLLSILVSVGCYVHNPDLTIFHPAAVQVRNAAEYLARYAGLVTITSGYLLLFSALDIPLQHLQVSRKYRGGNK